MVSPRRLAVSAVLIVSATLGSCSFFSEPDAINNPTAKPAPAAGGQFRPYQSGQRVAGTILCEYAPDLDTRKIRKITLIIDDRDTVAAVTAPPYAFSFNTAKSPPGSHRLTFAIYLTGDNLGLMQLRQAPPAQSYTTTLVFDPTPPSAPTNVKFTYENGRTSVTWDPSPDLNFDHYTATVDFHTGYAWDNIDYTSPVRAASSCSDSIHIPGIPLHVTVTVGVSNNAETKYASVIDTILGDPLGLGNVASSVMLPTSALTVMSDGTLQGVSYATGSLVTVPLGVAGRLGWTSDGSSFIVKSGGIFSYFNSTTLEKTGTASGYDNLGDEPFFFVPGGWLARVGVNGVFVFDSVPPLHIRNWFQPFTGAGLFAVLRVPDGSGFIVEDGAWLMKIGFLGDSPFVAVPRTRLPLDVERHMNADWENSKIYGVADIGQVMVHDPVTLDSKMVIEAPSIPRLGGRDGTSRGVDMKVTKHWILVLYRFTWGAYGDARTVLIRYDKSTLKEVDRRYYATEYTESDGTLGVSGDEKTCFVSCSRGQFRVGLP